MGAFAAAAILLALAWPRTRGAGSGEGSGGVAGRGIGSGTGIGTGTGSGLGPGTGTGAGQEGDGPGSGNDGSGRGSDGPDATTSPSGDPAGMAVTATAADAPHEAPATDIAPEPAEALPEYGFTGPTGPAPATPVGVADGGPTRGAEGVAGGGTGRQIVDVVQAYPNSRVVVNLDATLSMQDSRDAVARVFPEILDAMQGGTIAVHVFRDITIDERNEVVIKATPRTRNRRSIESMIEKVKAVELRGGGDIPETGYQLVLANMRKYPPGTPERPNVEFIVTDAPEKQPELLGDLLKLAERTDTLVFVIDVSRHPPRRTQLR